MYLILEPISDPLRLTQDTRLHRCYAIADAVEASQMLKRQGWLVYQLDSLKRVLDIEVNTTDILGV